MQTHITLGKGRVAVVVKTSKDKNIPMITLQPMTKTFEVGAELRDEHRKFTRDRIVTISIENLESLQVVQECLDAIKFFLLKEKEGK